MDRLYVYNEEWEKLCKNDYLIKENIKIENVKNGIILPAVLLDVDKQTYKGGVVDENQNFVTGFCRRNPGDQFSFDINEGYNVEKNNLVCLNEEVVFGGVLVGHFGHVILECLSRLWWHIKNPNSTVKFAFLSIWERKKWFKDFFDLLGIEEDRIIFVDKPTQFINVICPEQSIYSWKGYKKEYIEIYKKIREKARIENSNKKNIFNKK